MNTIWQQLVMTHQFRANFMNDEMNSGLTPFVTHIAPNISKNEVLIEIENAVGNADFCLAMNRLLTHTARHNYNNNYTEFCIDYLDGQSELLGQLSFSDTKITDICVEDSNYHSHAINKVILTLTYQDALFYSREMLENNKGISAANE